MNIEEKGWRNEHIFENFFFWWVGGKLYNVIQSKKSLSRH